MSKVFKLIVDEDNEPVILEEDEVLEDILIRLESISHRIDDIQYSLIKNNDEASSLDLDISEIDFQSIKKYGVNLTPYYVIIKIQETPSYFKLPKKEPLDRDSQCKFLINSSIRLPYSNDSSTLKINSGHFLIFNLLASCERIKPLHLSNA